MLDNKTQSLIRDFAFNNSEKDDIHGFSHVERVYNLCLKLGKKLNANLSVLQIAALLHDIGRIDEKNKINNKNHAEYSADIAYNFLISNKLNVTDDEIKNIIHSIKSHSFSNSLTPKTVEAKILSDADKIDALGAIGLYRTIGFTIKNKGGIDQVIQHLENKILKLKDQLHLDLSKKMAEERELIIHDFYKKIINQK
ncbi:MAG: HD domain-containing protein [Promethearchaeota archaeon]|nr:MAG: HD domain-containing protein [Candidatus Lokiarchaeota archaeon]